MLRAQHMAAALALLSLPLTNPGSVPHSAGRLATTLVVTTTADLAAPCTPSAYSLRCAFDQADADVSGDTIAFNIPATDPGCVKSVIQQTTVSVCTISPVNTHFQGELPALIVNNTTIDGYTQPSARPNSNPMEQGQGDNAIITIQLDGTAGGLFVERGLQILGSGNTVRGLSITNFTNGGGLYFNQGFPNMAAAHNTVAGNFLGVAPDGNTGGANALDVELDIGTGSDTIGGTSPADANVIGGGAMTHTGPTLGVSIESIGNSSLSGAGANDVIEGNYVGTNAAGSAALGDCVGVRDNGGITITVGGVTPGARNVISGNACDGVESDNGPGGGRFGGVIEGNYIGTNAAGSAALGNGPSGFQNGNGVQISGPFLVGGASAAARNVISGNANAGVAVANGTSGAVVEGNYIGVNAAGTAALGNGIGIAFPQDFQIAGPSAGNILARNLISGNTGDGIADQSPSMGNAIVGNVIGLSAAGAALGNKGNGVDLTLNGAFARGPIEDTVAGNVIAHSGQSGVLVGALAHSRISRNAMAANGGLGIDLAPRGVVNCATPPPGPNDNTPCPVVTTATTTTVSGTACVTCTVEVYKASNEADDLGHGEGAVFLGSVAADGSGHWSLSLPAGRVALGQEITASATTRATTATPAETSEFGANVAVGP